MDSNIKTPVEPVGDSIAYVEQIKRDYEYFKTDTGKRIIEDLKRVAGYEFLSRDIDSNLHFVNVGMVQLINHMQNMNKFTAKQLIENDSIRR